MTIHPMMFPLAVALAAVAAALLTTAARAADPAPAAPGKSSAVTLEPLGSSGVKRITLSAKAAERLDVQIGLVSEDVVIRKQVVSGMVIYPQAAGAAGQRQAPPAAGGGGGFAGGFGGYSAALPATQVAKVGLNPAATAPAAAAAAAPVARGESWVVVNLSPGEFERIAKDRPARISPLYTRDKGVQPMTAMLSDAAPVEDGKRSMLSLHYVLPNADHGMASSTRVRVELQLAGSEDKQRVVPYNAIYYDAKGQPWVYVNTKPLTYERQRITVQRVVGNQAVISDGPAVGTQVVTVGAALLYGTEIFGK